MQNFKKFMGVMALVFLFSCEKNEVQKSFSESSKRELNSARTALCPDGTLCQDTYVAITTVSVQSNCATKVDYYVYLTEFNPTKPNLQIERSSNGSSWRPIQFIYGTSYSASVGSAASFSFTDLNPYESGSPAGGKAYYRIRMIYNQSTHSISSIKTNSGNLTSPICPNLPSYLFAETPTNFQIVTTSPQIKLTWTAPATSYQSKLGNLISYEITYGGYLGSAISGTITAPGTSTSQVLPVSSGPYSQSSGQITCTIRAKYDSGFYAVSASKTRNYSGNVWQ